MLDQSKQSVIYPPVTISGSQTGRAQASPSVTVGHLVVKLPLHSADTDIEEEIAWTDDLLFRCCVLCFATYPRRSPNGTRPNFATCWEVSQICKCTSKGSLPLKNCSPDNCIFCSFPTTLWLIRQYLVTKCDTEIRQQHCKLQRILCSLAKFHQLWSTNG